MSAAKKDPSKKPSAIPVNPKGIPESLREIPQYVVWGYLFRDQWTKPPICARTGGPARVDDPTSWSTGKEAFQAYRQNKDKYAGIGIVLTPDLGLIGIDLDDCVTLTGDGSFQIASWAQEIVDRFACYWEVSPSGTGLRGIGRGRITRPKGRKKGSIETYDDARYLTLTGQALPDNRGVADIQAEHDRWHREVWPDPPPPRASAPAGSGTGNGIPDDELLDRARNAANCERFTALYDGDPTAIIGPGKRYPSQSDADLALVSLLLFWTNGDTGRVDRLFRQSRLTRDKWTERDDYRERTIAVALQGFTGGFTGDQAPPGDGPTFTYDPKDPIFDETTNASSDPPPSGGGAAAPDPRADFGRLLTFREARNRMGREYDWVVDRWLAAGHASLLVSKSGAGKTTLTSELAVAVARGESFLGRKTKQGLVVYFAFEGAQSALAHMYDVSQDPYLDNLLIWADDPGQGTPAQFLTRVLADRTPVLIVLDTLGHLLKTPLGAANAGYQQSVEQLGQICRLAQSKGTHVLGNHHSKKGDGVGSEAALGSTGIFATVDTCIDYRRLPGGQGANAPRILSSEKHRAGNAAVDFAPIVVGIDEATKRLTVWGSAEGYEEMRLEGAILGAVITEPGALQADVLVDVPGNAARKKRAIRRLKKDAYITVQGAGAKSSPFRLYPSQGNPMDRWRTDREARRVRVARADEEV